MATLVTVAVALAGVLIATVLALSSDRDDPAPVAAAEPSGPSEGVTAAPADGDAPLSGLTLTSFDPFAGDGENDDALPQLTDGDRSTQWTTVGYNSAAFGNLKPGVGILVDLGGPVGVSEVRLLGMPLGQSIELRIADTAPSVLEDTTVVAQATGLAADAALRPDSDAMTQFLVVWLVADLPADNGRFRGGFSEIEVIAS